MLNDPVGAPESFALFSSLLLACVAVQQVQGPIVHSRKIDGQLEQRVIFSCLEELAQFPERYVTLKSAMIH